MPEVGSPRHLVVIALEDLLELLEKEKSVSGYPGAKKMFNKLYNLYPTEVTGASGQPETWFGLEVLTTSLRQLSQGATNYASSP
eukprot:scaffold12.g8214.t1